MSDAIPNQEILNTLNTFSKKNSGNDFLPDYSSFKQIQATASGVVYTPLEDGWLRCEDVSGGDYRGWGVYFGTSTSGIQIARSYQHRYPGQCIMMVPVAAGQQYFITSNQNTIYFHKLLKRKN